MHRLEEEKNKMKKMKTGKWELSCFAGSSTTDELSLNESRRGSSQSQASVCLQAGKC